MEDAAFKKKSVQKIFAIRDAKDAEIQAVCFKSGLVSILKYSKAVSKIVLTYLDFKD